MSNQLERDVRFLKGYAVVTSVLLGVLLVGSCAGAVRSGSPAPSDQKVRFTEIDVERINVVEPNGMYRMVISNRPKSIGPIYKGKPFGYAGGTRPGIIFFNDEGTENGGLTFTGQRGADGRYRASTHMSFDQFDQDQVLNLDYSDQPGRRVIGFSVNDRVEANIYDVVMARDSITKAIADTAARNAAIARLLGPRNGIPFSAQRLFVGRDPSKSAIVNLADRQGKPRLRLLVDSLGAPRIEFLDAAGKVTYTLTDTTSARR
jgi:hypothetical protein